MTHDRSITPGPRFALAGEVDVAAVPALVAELGAYAATMPGTIEIDCSDMTFIDSSGLSFLLRARRALERKGRGVVVVNVSSRCRRVFEVAGVTALFTLDRTA